MDLFVFFQDQEVDFPHAVVLKFSVYPLLTNDYRLKLRRAALRVVSLSLICYNLSI